MDLIIIFFISTVASFFTFLFLNFRDIISEISKFKISKKEAFKTKSTRIFIIDGILNSIIESIFIGFIILGLNTMFRYNMILAIVISFLMGIAGLIQSKI